MVSYTKGLVNLSSKQDLDGCTKTISRLDQLYQNHPGILEVVVSYANGLANLSCKQDLDGCTETIARLDQLYQSHPDRENIATNFMGVLVNFSFYQKSESEVRCILARSSEIFERYPQNRDIQLYHAETWFNLTLQQREDDISATVTDIVDFLRSNTNVIPQFKEALNEYLCTHPDHMVRYQPLLHL